MRSRTSLFNKELFVQTFRSAGWISILYLLALLFALPLRLASEMGDNRQNTYYEPAYDTLFNYHIEIQMLFMFGAPILLALVLFRFMQSKQAAIYIHSLPIKRNTLLHHFTAAGMLFLLLPVVITALILLFMQRAEDLHTLFSAADVLIWAGETLLFTTLTFVSCIFVGMLTGMTAVQGVLTVIMLLFPYGISVLLLSNLSFFLNGFAFEYYNDRKLENLSPYTVVPELISGNLSMLYIVTHVLIIAALYMLALTLYKNRKIESVTQAVSIKGLQPIFIYGIAFCTMLFAGLYYGMTQNSSTWIFFGYLAGSLIGYLAASMIVEKTWRVAHKWKGYAVYTASGAAIIFLFQLDLTGYEKNVPEEKAIKSVYLLNNYYEYKAPEDSGLTTNKLTSKENISSVRRLHETIIRHDNKLVRSGYGDTVFIGYELHNGDKLIREYTVQSKDAYKEAMRPIIESEEYKKATNSAAALSAEEVEKIKITSNGTNMKTVTFTNRMDITEFTYIAQQELFNERYEGAYESEPVFSNIEFLTSDNETHQIEFKTSYRALEKWMIEKGEMKNARITPDELSHVILYKHQDTSKDPYDTGTYEDGYLNKLLERGEAVKVTVKKDIEIIIRNYHSGEDTEYLAALFYHDRRDPDFGRIDPDKVPQFLEGLK